MTSLTAKKRNLLVYVHSKQRLLDKIFVVDYTETTVEYGLWLTPNQYSDWYTGR